MNDRDLTLGQWRRAMAAGIVFVVLFVAGVLLTFGNSPDIQKKDCQAGAAAKFEHYLSSSGHRTGLVIGAYALIIAGLAFLALTQSLRTYLPSDAYGRRMLGSLGTIGAVIVAVAGILNATVAGAVSLGNEPLAGGDATRVLMDTFFPLLFLGFGLVSALLIGIITFAIRRERELPSWLGWTGAIAVLGALGAIEFVPFFLTLLWFLAVSIVGLFRPPTALVTAAPVARPLVDSLA